MVHSHVENFTATKKLLDLYTEIRKDLEDTKWGKGGYIMYALCSHLCKI